MADPCLRRDKVLCMPKDIAKNKNRNKNTNKDYDLISYYLIPDVIHFSRGREWRNPVMLITSTDLDHLELWS